MFILTLLCMSLLSLLFSTTRLFGVFALTLIAYQYPLLIFLLIALGCVYFYFNHRIL